MRPIELRGKQGDGAVNFGEENALLARKRLQTIRKRKTSGHLPKRALLATS